MVLIFLSWIKGKLFSQASALLTPLLGLIAIFLIYNSDLIFTKIGFETRSNLKGQVVALKANIEQLKTDKELLIKKIEELKQTTEIVTGVMTEYHTEKEQTASTVDELIQKRDKLDEHPKTCDLLPASFDTGKQKVVRTATSIPAPSASSERSSSANIAMVQEAYATFFSGVN